MRRLVLLLTAMALTLVPASGVALAVNKVGTNGPDTLRGTNGADNLKGGPLPAHLLDRGQLPAHLLDRGQLPLQLT